MLSSDNGPHMENWPDAGYTPFRSAKGSTWEGGVRVPGIVSWPGMIEPGQVSDGLFAFTDLLPTALRLAGVPDAVPADRFIDGVDQTTFLLPTGGASNRKFHYYWLLSNLAAVRAGEYKFTMRSTSDGATDAAGPGGFTGVDQHYTYPRLHNLYLDPKEERSYLTRKLAYVDVFGTAVRSHFHTYRTQPTTEWGGPEPGAAPVDGCVFCAIVAGEQAAEVVHRDDVAVAFLDRTPLFPGHVLVVPTAPRRDAAGPRRRRPVLRARPAGRHGGARGPGGPGHVRRQQQRRQPERRPPPRPRRAADEGRRAARLLLAPDDVRPG